MITTKVLVRPGTEYFATTVPRAIGEYLQLRQGDVLVWEFSGARSTKEQKVTCIRKGKGEELNGEVEE